MRIVFFGTPEVAADILKDLLGAKREIVAVVTQPDQPKGRGQKLTPPPVKEFALNVLQPEKLKGNHEFAETLRWLKPDLGIVVAYGKIIPQEILEIPKHGFINLHASLLPKYRGAAPIQWALLNGEKETGMTIFKLVAGLDAGPIILQKKVAIDNDEDAEKLSRKLFDEGKTLLKEALSLFDSGTVCYTEQNESEVTFAPLLTKESGEIDWRKRAAEIHNRIRALINWPTAQTFRRGKALKIFSAAANVPTLSLLSSEPGKIAEIAKGEGFIVVTGEGNLLVKEVQPAGGKRMKAYDYAIGHDVKTAETLPN